MQDCQLTTDLVLKSMQYIQEYQIDRIEQVVFESED